MEKILNMSKNPQQESNTHWELVLYISHCCVYIKYITSYFIACCSGPKGLNIVLSAFLFPSYTRSAGIWI